MKIIAKDFIVAGERTVNVPDKGVTVVTGPNGVGKSTLFAEPLAWALFGKTLRGVTIKKPCSVTLDLGPLKIKAVRTKAASQVLFGDGTPETATKGWKALGEILQLDFDLWHRTHVFSIEKVAKFSSATDTERKALLEALLGLEKYDRAQKAAKEGRVTAHARLTAIQSRLHDARVLFAEAEKDIQLAKNEKADMRPVDTAPLVAEARKVRSALARWAKEVEGMKSEEADAVHAADAARQIRADALADVNAKIKALKASQAALNENVCPACDRPLDAEHDLSHAEAIVKRAEEDLQRAREAALRALPGLQATAQSVEAVQGRRSEKEAQIHQAERKVAEIDKAVAVAEAERKQHAAIDLRIQALQERLDARQKTIGDLAAESTIAGRELEVLTAAVNVLGAKGVRSRLLDQGLAIVEAGANEVLESLGSVGRISLSATRPKADGTTADEIGMTVSPWGGDDGYDGASGGERKRIDIALVIGAAGLYRPPTSLGVQLPMIFDDVFDTLDRDGTSSVVQLMSQIAQARPVIVITQNAELADRIPAASRYDL